MIEWIGIACVAWTAMELLRMSAAATRVVPDGAGRTGVRPPNAARGRRAKRFAAWDDRGRPIDVEDLGTAARSR